MLANVECRIAPGFPDYRIGSDGAVWSLLVAGHPGFVRTKWKQLKAHQGDGGYWKIRLWSEGTRRTMLVHHLVLMAFVGPRPKGCWGLHGDANPSNNAVGNLRWGTPTENAGDRERHGNHVKGSAKENAKLSPADVAEVVALRKSGLLHREIAERFGCHQSAISRVLGGKRYKQESAAVA